MALIQFGKKEIEQLEIENERLRKELEVEEALRSHLNALLLQKDKEIRLLNNQLEDMEKIKDENRNLKKLIKSSKKNRKATLENIEKIKTLKNQGKSYRTIAEEMSKGVNDEFYTFNSEVFI